MANLLEALSQSPGMQDTTSGLSGLLRAKSGKSVGGPATALSSQQEQAALASTEQQLQPVKQQAAIEQQGQQQEAAGVQQQTGQQLGSIQQQRQANTVQTNIRTNQILQDLEQNKGKIEANRYQAGLEQVGQNLRLQTQQYTDNLQREGSRARLDDELQFKQNLAQSTFEDNKTLLEKQLGNQSILKANDREFSKAMSRLDASTAWTMFNNTAENEKQRALYTGIGGLTSAGIGAAASYAGSSPASSGPTNASANQATFGSKSASNGGSGSVFSGPSTGYSDNSGYSRGNS